MILYTSFDKKPHEIMLDACKLTNEANLNQYQLDEIKKFQELTCRKIIDEQYHRGIADVIAMKNTLFYEDLKKSEERGIRIGEKRGIRIGEDKKEFHMRIHIIKNLLGKISNSDLAKSLDISEEELEEFIKENNLTPSKD